MIFKENVSDISVVGEVKSNKISIDQNNINFIITILSTNLYSNPIKSLIRENCSNAWDSHKEAGVEEPIIIELGKDTEGNMFCSIRDFGVGLSPERFESIYKNIGSSTKRSDNQQIGMYGIGRFSSLSYSDTVYITSNYEGIKYLYMMYKDGNSISIDLIDERPTEDRNGLEVKVAIQGKDYQYFYEAIREQLTYFEELYIIDDIKADRFGDFGATFNNFKIGKFKNFYVNTLWCNNLDIILGKVRYPLRVSSLTKKYYFADLRQPISLKFEVGDLDVTPNREEILYSTKNIEVIQDKLDAALLEIVDITEDFCNRDFVDIDEYINFLSKTYDYPILSDDSNRVIKLSVLPERCKYTLFGKAYDSKEFLECNRQLLSQGIVSNYNSENGRISNAIKDITLRFILDNPSKYKIADISSLKKITKDFLRERYFNKVFLDSKKSLFRYYKVFLRDMVYTTYDKCDSKITKLLMHHYLKRLVSLEVITDDIVTSEFIADRIAARKKKSIWEAKAKGEKLKGGITLGVVRESERGSGIVSVMNDFDLGDIEKKTQKLKVYAEKDHPKLESFYLLVRGLGKYVKVFTVAPTKMKHLKDIKSFVHIDDIMDVKYKLIRKIGTALLIKEELPMLKNLNNLRNLAVISNDLCIAVNRLQSYVDEYYNRGYLTKGISDEILQLCRDSNYFDEEMRAVLNLNKELIKKAEFLLLFEDTYKSRIKDECINTLVDYILARKMFRPDLNAVQRLKEYGILNVKKPEVVPQEVKKDEDN